MEKDKESANFSAPKVEDTVSSYEFETSALLETDAMGREKFWEDLGRPNE